MRRAVLVVPLLLGLLACTPPKKEIVDLKTFDYAGGDIRSGSIEYAGNPPAGGPYNAFWQTCAAYSAPIYDEYAVHSLARGAIWAAYRPGLAASELQKIQTLLATPLKVKVNDQEQEIKVKALLAPRENLPAPIVLSAWNAQVTAQTADDENLKLFVERYGQGDQVPEAGASCAGGFNGTK